MLDASDRLDVAETVYSYATGIDTRDWALYRSIFADEVDVDFSSYNSRPATRMAADAWVSGLKPLFSGLAATQHSMTNPRVRGDGDAATCRVAMQAEHLFVHDDGRESWFGIGGEYTDRLRRHAGGWRIEAVTLEVRWRRGDAGIMALATTRGAALLAASS